LAGWRVATPENATSLKMRSTLRAANGRINAAFWCRAVDLCGRRGKMSFLEWFVRSYGEAHQDQSDPLPRKLTKTYLNAN